MAKYPSELRYTKDHEWARLEGDLVRVGITSYAVEQLGDVAMVDLPAVGTKVESEKQFGEIESVKTVSVLFAPVGGEVTASNGELKGAPELVNESPYDKGWMVVIRPSQSSELDNLMDAAAYETFVAGLDH